MDQRYSASESLLRRIRIGISRRVHDRRLQNRLQVGSALGLGVGLLFAAIIFSGILRPVSASFSRFLLIETVPSPPTPIEQDHLTQIVIIFLLAISAGVTLPHFRVLSAVALTIIYILLYLMYAFDKFNTGTLVEPLYPTLAMLLTFVLSTIFRYLSEERERAFISRLFRRYVAPETADHVINDFVGGALPLGGVRRRVSVLAVDLSELEPLVGSLAPEALIGLLNQYIAMIVAIVFRGNGAIVNYTGSTLLAMWNLFTDEADHARRAVYAAMEIKHELAQFEQKQPKESAIKVGIGITTGEVVAGHSGTHTRAEYTIIGEAVGMAERIAIKPERGVFIDGGTREQLGDEFELIEVKPVRLRRKTDPSQVWQLVEPVKLQEEVTEEGAEITLSMD